MLSSLSRPSIRSDMTQGRRVRMSVSEEEAHTHRLRPAESWMVMACLARARLRQGAACIVASPQFLRLAEAEETAKSGTTRGRLSPSW